MEPIGPTRCAPAQLFNQHAKWLKVSRDLQCRRRLLPWTTCWRWACRIDSKRHLRTTQSGSDRTAAGTGRW